MKYLLVILFLILVDLHGAEAQQRQQRLDSLYTKMYRDSQFNGNVLIAEKGKVIFEKSYGLANEQTGQKLKINSVFELASVSKQFTAMGIVLLKKQGKIAYSDKISKYIPELSFYGDITIRQLLIHTAGLPDYMAVMAKAWDKSKIASNEDMVNVYQRVKPELIFKPDQDWQYNNTGYVLLAVVIERVTGKSFGAYLKQYIFKPLGMKHTFIYRRRFKPEKIADYAQGYVYSDSLKRKIIPDELGRQTEAVYLDGITGDGMVNSTLHDLLRWDRALYSSALVSGQDKAMIFSSFKIKNGKETNYGFGWYIDYSRVYGKRVSHSGGWAGYLAYIERDLDDDKTIIILQNNDTEKIEIPVKNTRKIVYGFKPEHRISIDTTALRMLTGRYKSKAGNIKEVLLDEGKLYVRMNERVKLELIPLTKTRFIADGFSPEVIFEFFKDTRGRLNSYRSMQEDTGAVYYAKKID